MKNTQNCNCKPGVYEVHILFSPGVSGTKCHKRKGTNFMLWRRLICPMNSKCGAVSNDTTPVTWGRSEVYYWHIWKITFIRLLCSTLWNVRIITWWIQFGKLISNHTLKSFSKKICNYNKNNQIDSLQLRWNIFARNNSRKSYCKKWQKLSFTTVGNML